jgi:Uma2 family endonuclease
MAVIGAPVGVVTETTAVSDRQWTIQDLEHLPSGYRYEILEGVLYMTAMPAWPHPGIAANLAEILSPWVRSRRLGRLLPRTGIYLTDTNYVDPDLIFLRRDQYPRKGDRPRSAALAVEVTSTSNRRMPREAREDFLRQSAVEEVWYIDPEAPSVEIRRLTPRGCETTALFRDGDEVTSAQLPGLSFPVTALWEDLGDE